MKSLSWRVLFSLFVLLLSVVYILPNFPIIASSPLARFLPSSGINLGLDLKGGMHLTLGVEVDKAVTNALSQAGQSLKSTASEKGITLLSVRLMPGGRLEWIVPRAEQRNALQDLLAKNFPQLLVASPTTLDGGGLRYSAVFTTKGADEVKDFALNQALRTLRNRIDQFGVAEPDIRKQAGYRIQIQLPGMTDPQRAIQLLGQTAQLTFHLVRDDIDTKGILPPGVTRFPMKSSRGEGNAPESIVLDREPLMTGEDVVDARPRFDGQNNQPYVSLSFNPRGASTFARITGEHIKRRMAIVLDGTVHTAPTIQDKIVGGSASITGYFNTDSAQDLAIVLRAGALPAPVVILEERTVGPSLGRESIESGILAAAVGGLAVVIIMPVYYAFAGLLADLMLLFTMSLLMAGLGAFGATLTLPGIAGIVLTIGMSVDANVLIFERIREELRLGLKPLGAIAAGFERASISIIDSNVTTIIAAAILYQFGTGPVRGFAVTLTLGIVASMFTAIFVSRAAFKLWIHSDDKTISI